MSDAANIPKLPITNPDYGSGVYRRRLQLLPERFAVTAELEDNNHGFRVRIEHDGQHVTQVTGNLVHD
jgi:hypothetical protein